MKAVAFLLFLLSSPIVLAASGPTYHQVANLVERKSNELLGIPNVNGVAVGKCHPKTHRPVALNANGEWCMQIATIDSRTAESFNRQIGATGRL